VVNASTRDCAVNMAANRIGLGAADLAEIAQRTLRSTDLEHDRELLKSIKTHLQAVIADARDLEQAVKARTRTP